MARLWVQLPHKNRCADPSPARKAVFCGKDMGTTAARIWVKSHSGSPLDAIHAALSQLGILECFSVVISSESVARGKPHPDVFLAAANALGMLPNRCLVFEDSLIGVRAAVATGMRVVCVPSGPSEEIRRITPYVFESLADVINEAPVRACLRGGAESN